MSRKTLVNLVKDFQAAKRALDERVRERLPPGRRCVYLPEMRLTRVTSVVADCPDMLVVERMVGNVSWHTVAVESLYPVPEDWCPGAEQVPPNVDIPLWGVDRLPPGQARTEGGEG